MRAFERDSQVRPKTAVQEVVVKECGEEIKDDEAIPTLPTMADNPLILRSYLHLQCHRPKAWAV